MLFTANEDCIRLGLRAGAVVFRGVQVTPAPPTLREEIVREARAIQQRMTDPQVIRTVPEVIAFQELLRKVGVNPRREQPSVERLLGYVLKRGDLPAINSLVDAYNLVSVRSLCSLGAHDLDRFTPPATLRLLTGQESFTALGRDTPMSVIAGEYGYVDAEDRVLCRLDLLQAEFSKVTAETVNALLIVEGTATHAPDVLRRVMDDAVELILRYCGGTGEIVASPHP
jgi:DNA/RNA-binding domain of Phe-tRNA-synthetase-like protein